MRIIMIWDNFSSVLLLLRLTFAKKIKMKRCRELSWDSQDINQQQWWIHLNRCQASGHIEFYKMKKVFRVGLLSLTWIVILPNSDIKALTVPLEYRLPGNAICSLSVPPISKTLKIFWDHVSFSTPLVKIHQDLRHPML